MKEEILREASKVYKAKDYRDYIMRKKNFTSKYSEIEPQAVAIFLDDGLIKTKYSMELRFHHLINTTNLLKDLSEKLEEELMQ